MTKHEDNLELSKLILELTDGSISNERLEILDQWLHRSPEALNYYREFMKNTVVLKRRINIILNTDKGYLNPVFWKTLSEHEKIAPAIELPKVQQQQELISDVRQRKQQLRREQKNTSVNKPFLFTTLASMAALFLVIIYLQLTPQYVTVATVKECMNIQSVDNKELAVGSRLTNRRDLYRLKSGIIEIEFDYGAKVVIEAPAEFNLDSDEKMHLNSGRLYAKVPDSATGFMVDTPTSRIIDLGTEFGVKVDADGISDVHMFKGKASLISGTKGKTQNSQILTVGRAKRIDSEGLVKDIPIEEKKFARTIFSETGIVWRGQDICLADIVGGGNGLGTGHRDYAIDPYNGTVIKQPVFIQGHPDWRSSGFKPVPEIEGIDGIFIPYPAKSPVVISSQNHIFKECPATSGVCGTPVINGAKMQKGEPGYPDGGPLLLKGQACGTEQSPCIFMHANSGVTFDLKKLREAFPERQSFSRFKALAGVPENYVQPTYLDIWILIDGQVYFSRPMATTNQVFEIDLPLTDREHFLTLIVTDGINDTAKGKYLGKEHKDWCVFVNPVLELQ